MASDCNLPLTNKQIRHLTEPELYREFGDKLGSVLKNTCTESPNIHVRRERMMSRLRLWRPSVRLNYSDQDIRL